MRRKFSSAAALAVLLVTMLSGTADAQKNPCNPCGGKKAKAAAGAAVNPCHAKMGTVFHVSDPQQRNTVTFKSEAPLEDIVGTSNQITGYVVFDPAAPDKGVVGEITIPTSSLTTGIPLRDEHLQQADWLDAAKNPSITLKIEKAASVREVKRAKEFTTYEMTIEGRLAIRGKTRKVEIPATVTYLVESEKTRTKMPGDLLAGRATFDVTLSQFGVKGFDGVVGSKVSDEIAVSVSLMGSSQSMTAMNPCNPCGGKKAMNPCNPCGGKKAENPCGGRK